MDLVLLVGIVSISAILLARIWMQSLESVSAPVSTPVVNPANVDATPMIIAAPVQAPMIAPDFRLSMLDGGSFSLAQHRGQPVIVNFWASWCAPCRAEMPELVRVYELYREHGLIVVGVNVTTQDSVDNARRFVEEFRVTYPVVLDEIGTVSSDMYGVIGLPTSFFVNVDGNIQRTVMGEMTSEALNAYVREIVPENLE